MQKLKVFIPAAVLCAGFLINTAVSYGTAAYTKKEKKGCIVCHTKANSKELNEAGKYYEKNKTLDGYKK